MKTIGFPFGISFTFWLIVGLFRYFTEVLKIEKKYKLSKSQKLTADNVAAIIPAHNEELVIRDCIKALKLSLSPKQIYVVSDGSSDKTCRRARLEGCHVANLTPGRGKAKAMIYLIKKFRLFRRYKLIFIVDADTKIDKHFIEKALPLFADPNVSVVFGSARIYWPSHVIPTLKLYYIAYRERLNRMLQFFLIKGMTWKYTNVNFVVPGFATIYRSKILKKLEIDTPGLLIEDFNLAFQIHKKKLGTIGYNPECIGNDQHPDNLVDYWSQVRRWNIGFFQTVKVNGIWPSFFQLALITFSFEVILNSIFMLFLPIVIIHLLIPINSPIGSFAAYYQWLYTGLGPYKNLNLSNILIGIFLLDYLMTVFIGIWNKKPQFIFYGIFFFFMHYVTSLILLSAIIPGFFGKSSGKWSSPARRSESIAM